MRTWEHSLVRIWHFLRKNNIAVTVTATPDEGWQFAYWLDENGEIISYDAEYTFEVAGDMRLIAVCEPQSASVPAESEELHADDLY